jgi:TolB-like protein/class 3 adenylate cyclase/tetratricopeptide (TPR) repeat protein
MEAEPLQRRLAAILSADVAGYSRLMGEDEAATVADLAASREAFARLVRQFHGRIVNAPGDAILAEFGSVVDAVACSVEIQRDLAERNAERPQARRMEFRIGVNLGDVIVREGDLYGDGVNIAARLQALADPGGICISGSAHAEVKTKLPLEFDFQGRKSVKNIAEPVAVFRVLSRPGAAAHRVVRARRTMIRHWRRAALALSALALIGATALLAWKLHMAPAELAPPPPESAGLPLPEQPSIAVLPFVNMSGDPDQEYFADGVTETLITDLSKLRQLKVIARNSVFTYKGKAVDVRDVSRDLGVLYVLEGSIQKAGTRIRVTTQLIDASTGQHVWAERYDRPMQDIFAVQDEITRRVVTELDVKLVEGESARVWRRMTSVPEAYDYYLRAYEAILIVTRERMMLARQLGEKALELDPKFAMAHFVVGFAHYGEAISGWTDQPAKSFELARASLQRAIDLDDSVGVAYAVLGALTISYELDHERALGYAQKGVLMNPSGAFEHAMLSLILTYSGKPEEGYLAIKKTFQLNPSHEPWYDHPLASALLFSGQHDRAIDALRRCLAKLPDFIWCQVNMTIAYILTGREAEGRAQAKEVLRVNPKFTTAAAPAVLRIKDPLVRDRFADALRRAGLP